MMLDNLRALAVRIAETAGWLTFVDHDIVANYLDSRARIGRQQRWLKLSHQDPDWLEYAFRALMVFNQANTFREMKQIIEANPILLTDGIDSVYEGMIKDVADSGDITAARFFTKRRELLRRSRKVGTERAFDEK